MLLGWLGHLDDATVICWVKLASGLFVKATVAQIKAFQGTELYQHRRPHTAYTGTIYKNFRVGELDFAQVRDMSNTDWWHKRPAIMTETKRSWPEDKLYEDYNR